MKHGDDPNAVKFKHNFASDLDDWEFKKMQGLGHGDISEKNLATLDLEVQEDAIDDLPEFLTSSSEWQLDSTTNKSNAYALKSSTLSTRGVNWYAAGKVSPIKD